jgi:asparagine synthase (glutamine-hydrolysing)
MILDLGEAVLAHSRLAVIDPTGGRQPMVSPDNRYTIVFNGEIYNFKDLRDELEKEGHRFTSRSDTEVLLHGYAAWGTSLLDRLDGMFAFAIWDSRDRILFAARDPLGIKPFVYAAEDGGLIFASTLAPFWVLPGFPRRLDAEALRDYLAFQTPLAPHTIVHAIRQLPPGHLLRFTAATGQLETERYWSIPHPAPCLDDSETLVARVDAALRTSVQRQITADVPLGAFLSGGVDSSLMVAYMAEAGVRPLKTFTMRFAEPGFDETPHARAVAHAFGCEHHELDAPTISGEDFANAVGALDQPLADPAYVTTHALARLTRQHVTVAISGDGGDELFCGYPRFLDTEDRHPAKIWQPWLRRLVDTGFLPSALYRRSLWGKELLHYRRAELGPWPGRKDLTQYLLPDVAIAARPENTLGLWRELIEEFGGNMDTATLMRADLWTYLSENCLVKTDRASMAHGLEVRVPMLGRPVLDVVLSLPAEAHLREGAKTLLLAIARRKLPATVWNREKHGFSTPLAAYFRGAWKSVSEAAITAAKTRAPFLNHLAVTTLWERATKGRASRRLAYTFVVLLLWLERHPLDD